MIDIPRTNNSVEAWHNAIHGAIGCEHPRFDRFVKFVISEQGRTEFKMNQLMAEMSAEKPRKKYRDYNARLKSVVENFASEKKSDLLKSIQAIAHNISYGN